jgi:hypothetical protein
MLRRLFPIKQTASLESRQSSFQMNAVGIGIPSHPSCNDYRSTMMTP